jgi:catechol 2,3-dioxygenase-like lactoylglutathione lyase family enzyme
MREKNFLQITPWLLASDVEKMVQFFVEVLGFRAWVQGETYAYVSRDDAAVRIGKLSEVTYADERVEWGVRAWLFYIDVRDVDVLVTELRPKLQAAGLNGGQGPKDQSWGKREFWAPLPGGGYIVFGQEIFPPPAGEN